MGEQKSQPEIDEQERKEIYKEVWKIQKALTPDIPDYRNKQQGAYLTVAKQHLISEDDVRQICIEGATKNWPAD